MKAVFASAQLAHAPTRFLSLGNIVAYPEAPERARQLLEGARTAGAQVFAARNYDPESFASVHGKLYLRFLQTAFEAWSKLPGSGPELVASLRPVRKPGTLPAHILGQ